MAVYQISYGYVSRLLDNETFSFWQVLRFSGIFPLITFFLGMINCLYDKISQCVYQISGLETAYSVFY